MKTTLKKILSHSPCNQGGPAKDGGWQKLLAHLGKTEADDEELSIRTILESNGVLGAIWALRAVDGHDKEIRLFAADCAESVLHIYEAEHPDDDRVRKAIQAVREYANGLISADELAEKRFKAWQAAGEASRAAAWAAGDASRAASRAAAWAAAWAAVDAARAAAGDASRAAVRAAVSDGSHAYCEIQKEMLLKYI
jgi:hypothetical protein